MAQSRSLASYLNYTIMAGYIFVRVYNGKQLKLMLGFNKRFSDLDGLLDVYETGSYDCEEIVESGHLLHQHSVHALTVLGRVAPQGTLRVKVLGQFAQNVSRHSVDYLIRR